MGKKAMRKLQEERGISVAHQSIRTRGVPFSFQLDRETVLDELLAQFRREP